MGGVDLYVCLSISALPSSLFILYWIIRLAVRHGIADADARRRTNAVLETYQEQKDH